MKRSLVCLGLACAACGDSRHPAALIMDVGSVAPAYGRAPFPNDAVREGPNLGAIVGLEAMAGAHSDLLAAHLQALDGWGLRPTIEFFVEGPLDPDTIPETTTRLQDALVVLDVDPRTPEHNAPLAWDWRYDATRGVIAGSPHEGTMLREGTRYAAVLTTDVHGRDGEPVFGDFSLGLLGQHPPDRWQTTATAYAELAANPALTDRIAGITVFTTQNATDALVKARDAMANVAAVPAPGLAFDDPEIIFDTPSRLDDLLGQATRDTSGPRAGLEKWGGDNPTGIAHDHIAVVATGTTTIARFRGDDTGTDGPEDETFQLGPYGVPTVQSVDTIPVSLVLPKGPVPATGFPVVIFGHGLGGSRHDMLDIAEPLASKGYAVIAIDMWGHGSRYDATDEVNNLGSKPDFTGKPDLRDGFGDVTSAAAYLDFFEGFTNVSAIRDSIRQSALDFARLATLVQTQPDLSALSAPYGGKPTLDPTRVAYLGQSFGTIVGVDLAAIEPSVGLYVLDVPGGGVLDQILPNSPAIGSLAVPFAEQIYHSTGTLDRFNPLVGVMQAIFDSGDSLTYAHHVLSNRLKVVNQTLGKRHVVCIEVIGDELMPNQATGALARALGLGTLKPDLDPPSGLLEVGSPASGNVLGQTGVLVQYSPATHGFNWSAEHGTVSYVPGYPFPGDEPYPKLPAPITISEPIYETQAQVAEILSTYFDGADPLVRSTLAPVHDFDGDGKPDDQDPDPLDPTK